MCREIFVCMEKKWHIKKKPFHLKVLSRPYPTRWGALKLKCLTPEIVIFQIFGLHDSTSVKRSRKTTLLSKLPFRFIEIDGKIAELIVFVADGYEDRKNSLPFNIKYCLIS